MWRCNNPPPTTLPAKNHFVLRTSQSSMPIPATPVREQPVSHVKGIEILRFPVASKSVENRVTRAHTAWQS